VSYSLRVCDKAQRLIASRRSCWPRTGQVASCQSLRSRMKTRYRLKPADRWGQSWSGCDGRAICCAASVRYWHLWAVAVGERASPHNVRAEVRMRVRYAAAGWWRWF